jgi:NAD(P)H-quinone oxidoreductase subunit 2
MNGIGGIEDYKLAIQLLSPETFLTVTIIITALWNLFVPKLKGATPYISLAGLAMAFFTLWLQLLNLQKAIPLFGGVFTIDTLTIGFGLIVTAVGLIVVLMTTGYEHHFPTSVGEFYAILLTAILSVMFLAGATDLIMLFVSLETLSICCVILSGFEKRDKKSNEASLKYLLSTAATTATLLYGLSFVYGLTGSTVYSAIHDQMAYLSLPPASLVKMFLLVLILSAVGFKLSAVPFHMWTPDVYEGAPTPVTAFLSIGSKAGGFVVALRLLLTVFGSSSADWTIILSVLAVLSMITGNLIALAQSSFKRMLAYSSIAHVGYMLIGLAANSESGLISMLFYIMVYGIMNLGAFAGAIMFSNETGSDKINDMSGLIRKRPYVTVMLAICLFNLAGLPIPPAGFFAKVFIFIAGVSMPPLQGSFPIGNLLVGLALATTIPAIYYYTRVAIKMIVAEPSAVVEALPDKARFSGSPQGGPAIALFVCVVIIFATGTAFVDPIVNFAHNSIRPVVPGGEHANPIGFLPTGITK